MAEEKKYEITVEDIGTYIGLAINEALPEDISPEREMEFVDFFAKIASRIEKHLNGEKPFKQEDFAIYKLATTVLDVFEKIGAMVKEETVNEDIENHDK